MATINWTNFTDFGDLPQLANQSSNGTFWTGMFYMIWVILMLLFIGYGFEVALVVGSFLTLVLGLLLLYADLITVNTLWVVIAVLVFALLYVLWSSSKGKS